MAQLVAGTAYAEAALLRQWVLTGMQQFRITAAIRAYQEGALEVAQAAAQARLPVAVFLDELAARQVAKSACEILIHRSWPRGFLAAPGVTVTLARAPGHK